MKEILLLIVCIFSAQITLCLSKSQFDGDPFLSSSAQEDDVENKLPPLHLINDPCETTVCGRGRECEVDALGEARCICIRRCGGRRRKAVCGTDGRRYPSHCSLHRAACVSADPHLQIDRSDVACKNASLSGFVKKEVVEKPGTAWHPLPPFEASSTVDPPTHRECSQEDYDFMKENLLLFNNQKLTDTNKSGNEYLISIMFSHYDQNNNGQLEAEELWQAAERDQLGQLSSSCILADMLLFDDADGDARLDVNEFYLAFSVSVVSLDKSLEVNHIAARVGDNVEIKCDVTGTPPPPITWRRNDFDLSALNDQEIKVSQMFVDGSLYLTSVQLVHAGNYTCHARRNRDVTQIHILRVHTVPEVSAAPRLQWRAPGESAEMECRAAGVPQPHVTWLKNDEPLHTRSPSKYTIIGNSTGLVVGKATYSDTGAYMCVAANAAGAARDISSLVVQEQPPTPPHGTTRPEHRLFVFHERGVSVFEPSGCRLRHQIQSTDVIPGTQEYVCGDRGTNCSWGSAIDVADRYVYVSQPERDRVLVLSRTQMVVVDVVVTDKFPVELHYIPNLEQVWVVCWRGRSSSKGQKSVQIIRDAAQKKKHHTVHPEPVDGHFDLVSDLLMPSAQDLGHGWRYGYVVHTNQRGMYKLDLRAMRYLKTVDLTPYNCAPRSADFASYGGLVFLECLEPVTGRPTGQVILDYLTDTVRSHDPNLLGSPHVSPDSRRLLTLRKDHPSGTLLVAHTITDDGIRFLFDVKTTLRISDIAFYPSRTTHGYDLYATSADREDVLYVDLADGRVEMITGVGRAPLNPSSPWGMPLRPLATPKGSFADHLATAGKDALFILNGRSRTVNCEVSALPSPSLLVWARAP